MVGWHHRLNGHESEQTLGDREGQGSLVCCSPGGCKESDMTGRLNNKVNDSPRTGAHSRSHLSLRFCTYFFLFLFFFKVTSRQRH